MTRIISFSGWGQEYDALENIAHGAMHVDYKSFENIESLFKSMENTECDLLIGWSLGGQVALRALSSGTIRAKALVLLATPFQFVAGGGLKCGIDMDNFNNFVSGFKKDPVATLKQFALLVGKNDENAKDIIRKLKERDYENVEKWAYWLDELGNFSCSRIDFSRIPKTLAIHGRDDSVVDVSQTGLFRPFIADYKLEVMDNCGHAPHLHNEPKVKRLVKDFV